jgi:hypothetical protein
LASFLRYFFGIVPQLRSHRLSPSAQDDATPLRNERFATASAA